MPGEHRPRRNALADLGEAISLGFLVERHDVAGVDRTRICPWRARLRPRDRLGGDGDVGLAIHVLVDKLAVVHPVQ